MCDNNFNLIIVLEDIKSRITNMSIGIGLLNWKTRLKGLSRWTPPLQHTFCHGATTVA